MKKKITAVFALFMLLASNAYAYNFPQPDWTALYNQRQSMVNTAEFELYAQGSADAVPYYGARLEPVGGAYIGMAVTEASQKFKPFSSYLAYMDTVGQTDLYYPQNSYVHSDNVVATVGWNFASLDSVNYNNIRNALNQLNSYNKPMFIRFANEMNSSTLGNEPSKYVEIFRNVANMVHEYPNFAVVWSPNDMGALDRPFEYYYPGNEYVDWVGLSCYMIKYFQGNKNAAPRDTVFFMTGDNAWATNKVKPLMDFMAKNNIQKPVMISEGGVDTNNSYGENMQDWAAPRLRNMLWYLVMKYPQIKLINYFDVHRQYETEKFDISNYPYAVNIFNEAKNCGAYSLQPGVNSEFSFQKANSAGTLSAKDGAVKLYTYAYLPGIPEMTVNYFVDGVWYGSSNQIPYSCNLTLSDFADGEHQLRISAYNSSKTYTFYKIGSCIRFGAQPDIKKVFTDGLCYTNVRVFVNGIEIPTFMHNKDGKIAVICEDLANYGFDISWNGDTRQLYISKNSEKPLIPTAMEYYRNLSKTDVLYKTFPSDVTAVKVNQNGEATGTLTDVYNINGYTAVVIDDLADFGEYIWNGDSKTIDLITR